MPWPKRCWPTRSASVACSRMLDDPDIQDIHVRGCESTWIKRRDGSRRPAPPVVDTDDELVELDPADRRSARVAPSAASTPLHRSSTSSCPTAHACSLSWTSRPARASIIRKHLFSLSSLSELRDRGLIDDGLQSFLAAAVRARRNMIVTGGTGTGKTTLLAGAHQRGAAARTARDDRGRLRARLRSLLRAAS